MWQYFYGTYSWGPAPQSECCDMVVYSLAWAPDDARCEWMVPGTYEDACA